MQIILGGGEQLNTFTVCTARGPTVLFIMSYTSSCRRLSFVCKRMAAPRAQLRPRPSRDLKNISNNLMNLKGQKLSQMTTRTSFYSQNYGFLPISQSVKYFSYHFHNGRYPGVHPKLTWTLMAHHTLSTQKWYQISYSEALQFRVVQ